MWGVEYALKKSRKEVIFELRSGIKAEINSKRRGNKRNKVYTHPKQKEGGFFQERKGNCK